MQIAERPIPDSLARAVAAVRARMNAWVALDATLAGLATGAAVGASVAAVLWIARMPMRWALLAGASAAIIATTREARARWVDSFAAASTLDALLGAKDRFVSALHFAAATDATAVHRMQIEDAASFLDRAGRRPAPPRPSMRFPRVAMMAAVVATACLASPFVRNALAHWHGVHLPHTDTHDPVGPQQIAARAAALRDALRDSPSRRIDAEINALEHALEEQAVHAEAERTQAIERAANAIEQAHKADIVATQPGAHDEAATPPATANAHAQIESPETRAAREALLDAQRAREQAQARENAVRDELRRVERASAAVQHNGGDAQREHEAQQRRDELAVRIAQLQSHQTDLASQEHAAEQSLQAAQQRDAATQAQHPRNADGTPAATAARATPTTLDDAVRHLDAALQSIQRTDHSAALPSVRAGRAIDQAGREIGGQLPETASALDDAARARDANDGQRVDEALARARASLSLEAHAEPDAIRRAREAMDGLHDQVAQNAIEQRQNGQTGHDSQEQGARGDEAQRGARAINREQEALRDSQDGQQGQGAEQGANDPNGDATTEGQQGQQSHAGQPGQRGQAGRQGQNGQQAQAGQRGENGQQGMSGESGQSGRRAESGQQGEFDPNAQGARQGGQRSWGDGMSPADGANGSIGPSMQAPPGVQMGHGNGNASAQNGATGGSIGNDHGNSNGMGRSQGNRTVASGQNGSQAMSHFDRGDGATEADGRNQMSGAGPGQGHGATGASGGRTPGGAGDEQSHGGHAWGNGAGGTLTQAPPVATGPFGHDVDPGGNPREQAQLAPGARGWMMPGVAQRGTPTGPTSDAPIAPGSLLPSAPGDGALGTALDEDPEQTMATQRVPPSLRAYVRRYFQGIQDGSVAGHRRSQ